MTRVITLAALIGFAATLTGCAGVYSPVGNGVLYTNVDGPVAATSGSQSTKMGSASCINVLGLVAVGDASITAACEDGGITQIHHIDHNSHGVLLLFSSYKTIVYGE